MCACGCPIVRDPKRRVFLASPGAHAHLLRLQNTRVGLHGRGWAARGSGRADAKATLVRIFSTVQKFSYAGREGPTNVSPRILVYVSPRLHLGLAYHLRLTFNLLFPNLLVHPVSERQGGNDARRLFHRDTVA